VNEIPVANDSGLGHGVNLELNRTIYLSDVSNFQIEDALKITSDSHPDEFVTSVAAVSDDSYIVT